MADNLLKLTQLGKGDSVVSVLAKEDRVPVNLGYRTYKGTVKPLSVKKSQTLKMVHLDDKQVFPLTPAPATSSFTSNTKMDLVVPRGSAGRIKDLKLRIRCQNTDASNTVTPAIVYVWFDKIEICSDQGTKTLQTLYGVGQYVSTGFVPNDKWNVIAPLAGTTSAWGNNSAIAVSTSIDYYMNLHNSIFKYSHVNLKALDNDLIIRMWALPSVSSGTGTLAVNGIEVLCEHESTNSSDEKMQLKHYMDYIVADNIVDQIRIQNTATITANQNNDISLRQLTGTCHGLALVLCAASSNTSNGLTTFAQLETSTGGTLDLIGPNGQSLLANGNSLQLYDIKNMVAAKHLVNPNIVLNKHVYFIPFSHNLSSTIDSGNIDGCFAFDSKEYTLRIKPHSAFSTGTYYVTVIAFMAARLLQSDGKIVAEYL